MASINYAIREISVKIVFYGPGLSGKTTNLQVIHRKIPIDYRSDMVSLATETDRTLFFDFLPLDLGKIKGFSTKFQLYTVPGQVYYNATRKLVLRGVDGVVFVADSAQDKTQENLESFQNLHDNLAEYGIKQGSIPIVIQYNKRDLPNALPIEALEKALNKFGYPWNEAVANQGKGVFESLKIIGKIVIDSLNRKYSRPATGQSQEPAQRPQVQAPPPQQAPQRPAADPYYAPSQPQARMPQAPVPPPRPVSAPQYQDDIFQGPQQGQPVRPQAQAPRMPPAPPQTPKLQPQAAPRNDYYDYGSINLEPMAQEAAVPKAAPASQPPSVDKTDLDLEIEKYQKEIEEKQRRLRSLQSSQAPQQETASPPPPPRPRQQQNPFPAPQKGSYDVYDLPETDDQIPQFPPRQAGEDSQEAAPADGEQPLYFTSVNTGQRKKTKRPPVNPKTRQQGSFLSKFFNKDKPQ
jgi:signal recognition particle receptor subunit beta